MASPRIQLWVIFLSAYEYDLQYREGKKHANADGLSRLPLSDTVTYVPSPGDTILVLEYLESTPVKSEDIAKWTSQDTLLQRVVTCMHTGWSEKCPVEDMRPYHNQRTELSLQNGCIFWGNRVIIPPVGHPVMVRMKNQSGNHGSQSRNCYIFIF